ncbi:MAG: hypothetical protein ACXWWT_12905, partial [Candidatus Deferrimicrobiaceae bacterium]
FLETIAAPPGNYWGGAIQVLIVFSHRSRDQARNGVMSRDTSPSDGKQVRHVKEALSRTAGK